MTNTPEFAGDEYPKFAIFFKGEKYAMNEIDMVLAAMRNGAEVEVYPVRHLTSRKQKLFSLGHGQHIDITPLEN